MDSRAQVELKWERVSAPAASTPNVATMIEKGARDATAISVPTGSSAGYLT